MTGSVVTVRAGGVRQDDMAAVERHLPFSVFGFFAVPVSDPVEIALVSSTGNIVGEQTALRP